MASQLVTHTLAPFYNKRSKILILGTMPSPKSREYGFYYAHPQNRFWKVLAALFSEPFPESIEERAAFLESHCIALWDVLASCTIEGADDSSIGNPVPNDLSTVLKQTAIGANGPIFTTGTKAASLYKKYCLPAIGISSIALPSTSPANCRNYNFEKLVESYRIILNYL